VSEFVSNVISGLDHSKRRSVQAGKIEARVTSGWPM